MTLQQQLPTFDASVIETFHSNCQFLFVHVVNDSSCPMLFLPDSGTPDVAVRLRVFLELVSGHVLRHVFDKHVHMWVPVRLPLRELFRPWG